MKILSLLILITVVLSPMAQANMTPAVKSLEEHLKELVEYDDIEDVENELWSRVNEQPYNSENYAILGLFYEFIGDHENELYVLKKQVTYLPDDHPEKDIPYGNLARAYMLNDQWEEGKYWLDKADEISMENSYNRWNAFGYYTQYNFDPLQAATQLSLLDQMSEKDYDPFFSGFSYMHEVSKLSIDQMVEVFEEVVKQNPDNHKALRNLAGVLRFKALKDESIFPRIYKLLEKSIRLAPEFTPTYLTMANAHLMEFLKEDPDKARSEFLYWSGKAKELAPDEPKIYYSEGNCYYMTGDHPKAIESFNLALDKGMKPENVEDSLADAYNSWAYDIYKSGKDLQKGLELIEKAVALSPDDGIILSTKAELLYALGRYDEAWEYIQVSYAQYPDKQEIREDYERIRAAISPNSRVMEVESALADLGYDPGEIDGVIDVKTRDAIKSFQVENKLTVTSFVDSATWEKLKEQ